MKPPYAIGSVPSLSGHAVASLFPTPTIGMKWACRKYRRYTNINHHAGTPNILLLPKAPIHVCLDGTITDSSTILVTMYYCGYVGV